MNRTTKSEWSAIHGGLLVLAGQLGEMKQMLAAHPTFRKAVAGAGATYTAIKHVEMGQGITRTYTVTYTYDQDGVLELLDVTVEE